MGRVGDLNTAGFTEALEAAGHVDSVSPQVVGKFLAANHAGHQGTGVDSNPDANGALVAAVKALDLLLHIQREVRYGFGVVRSRRGYAPGDHVGVADGLDFFQTPLFCESVEGGKDLVEKVNDLLGADVGSQSRKSDEVGKENSGLRILIDDVDFAVFHAGGDGTGEDAAEKVVGLLPFDLELIEELLGTGSVADAQDNIMKIERLVQEIACPRSDGRQSFLSFREGCDHQDRDLRRAGVFFEAGADFEAGHFWHHYIQKNQVSRVLVN